MKRAPSLRRDAAGLICDEMPSKYFKKPLEREIAMDMWPTSPPGTFAGAAIDVIARLLAELEELRKGGK